MTAMSHSEATILKQLRSRSLPAVKGGLVALTRGYAGRDVPDALVGEVVTLFDEGPPWSDELIRAVLSCPAPGFVDLLERVLSAGLPHRKSYVLLSLDHWHSVVGRSCLAGIEKEMNSLMDCDEPWVAFLAAMQAVHIFGADRETWKYAAAAVKKADQMERWRCIRSQISEFLNFRRLDHEEVKSINAYLADAGTPEIDCDQSSRPARRKVNGKPVQTR